MPPPPSLRPLARAVQAAKPHARASISSTSKNRGVKDIGAAGRSASETLFNFDKESSSGPAAPSPNNPYAPAPGSGATGADLYSLMKRNSGFDNISERRDRFSERTKERTQRNDLAKQISRNWNSGDVYAPHDLSDVEMLKWKQPKRPTKDIIDILGVNPLDHYKNFAMMSEFMTDMGRIKHSSETGLRPVNQRKMARAIRRAIGMGIHPSTHRHPEVLFGMERSGPRYETSKMPEKAKNKITVK